MNVYHDIKEVERDTKSVITIGTYDGLHLAHRQVIDKVTGLAKEKGFRSFIVTFEPHPQEVLKNKTPDIKLLTAIDEKLRLFEKAGVENPIICSSINKVGFRMSGGKDIYEQTLKTKKFRAIAMQVLAAGAVPPREAIEYVCKLPNIESILFGASSKGNIVETASLIRQYDKN